MSFGVSAEEFRRVLFVAMLMLAAVGTVSSALKLDLARGFVVVALPLAAVLTLADRWLLRDRLHGARNGAGTCRPRSWSGTAAGWPRSGAGRRGAVSRLRRDRLPAAGR